MVFFPNLEVCTNEQNLVCVVLSAGQAGVFVESGAGLGLAGQGLHGNGVGQNISRAPAQDCAN